MAQTNDACKQTMFNNATEPCHTHTTFDEQIITVTDAFESTGMSGHIIA